MDFDEAAVFINFRYNDSDVIHDFQLTFGRAEKGKAVMSHDQGRLVFNLRNPSVPDLKRRAQRRMLSFEFDCLGRGLDEGMVRVEYRYNDSDVIRGFQLTVG